MLYYSFFHVSRWVSNTPQIPTEPKRVSRMNALETFVEQIKEYGKLYDFKGTTHFNYEYYVIDDKTYAIVVYDKDGNIHHATFRKR